MQQIIIILSKITTGVRKGFKRRTKCNPCTYLILRGKVSKHRGFNWQNCFNVRPVLSSPSLQQFQTSPNLSCTHKCFICPRLGFCLILFIFSQMVELFLGKKAPGRRMFCNFKEKRLHKFEKQFFFRVWALIRDSALWGSRLELAGTDQNPQCSWGKEAACSSCTLRKPRAT